ncbi:ADP-ribose glycohydrolase OARD1 isoform X5 [Pogona vitticeps]|uniref:ADP-ribose glycohydrolase OARD1 isoform X5 n=1 Tax=Pogona vitticeps TaxID=103695 RepID=A0ABM5G7A3_9SAUR
MSERVAFGSRSLHLKKSRKGLPGYHGQHPDCKRRKEKKTGDVAILKRDDRYVYYLITKSKYFYKPTYDNLRKSLEAMKIHSLKNAVTRISMPKIGCGLDRLDWNKVSTMLEEVFEDTDVYITVYTL